MQRLMKLSYLLENLQNLEELIVTGCTELREIITSEEEVMRSKAAREDDQLLEEEEDWCLDLVSIFSDSK